MRKRTDRRLHRSPAKQRRSPIRFPDHGSNGCDGFDPVTEYTRPAERAPRAAKAHPRAAILAH